MMGRRASEWMIEKESDCSRLSQLSFIIHGRNWMRAVANSIIACVRGEIGWLAGTGMNAFVFCYSFRLHGIVAHISLFCRAKKNQQTTRHCCSDTVNKMFSIATNQNRKICMRSRCVAVSWLPHFSTSSWSALPWCETRTSSFIRLMHGLCDDMRCRATSSAGNAMMAAICTLRLTVYQYVQITHAHAVQLSDSRPARQTSDRKNRAHRNLFRKGGKKKKKKYGNSLVSVCVFLIAIKFLLNCYMHYADKNTHSSATGAIYNNHHRARFVFCFYRSICTCWSYMQLVIRHSTHSPSSRSAHILDASVRRVCMRQL